MPADELAATAAAALATLPINKPAVLPSGGSVGTTELPLFAGGALQPPETEKNSYSTTMQHLIATQKRPPGGGTSSRRRVPDSELDMSVVTDQLCNRRYHVKEMSQNMKVNAVHATHSHVGASAAVVRCTLLLFCHKILINKPSR